MKIVQSYWSRPAIGQAVEGGRRTGGWASERYQCLGMALSCLLLFRFYNQVELITDEFGKELLIDCLRLPYTSVKVCLNDLDHYPHGLWSLSKLYAYSLQEEPFIHVDNDFFIWAPFGAHIEGAPLIAQSPEPDSSKGAYERSIKRLTQTLTRMSPLVTECQAQPGATSAINAGVLGGNDLTFIQEYAREAFALVDNNLEAFRQDEQAGLHNIVIEQYLFHQLALKQAKPIAYAIPKLSDDFRELMMLNQVPSINSYVHLVGSAKARDIICEQVENRLRYEFPQEYRRLCRAIDRMLAGRGIQSKSSPTPVSEKAYPLLEQFLQSYGYSVQKQNERSLRRLIRHLTQQLPPAAATFIREVFEVERIQQQMRRRRRTFELRRRRYLQQAYKYMEGKDIAAIMATSFTCTVDMRIVPTHWPDELFKASCLPNLEQLILSEQVHYLLIGNNQAELYVQEAAGLDHFLTLFQGVERSGIEIMAYLSPTFTSLKREEVEVHLVDFLTYQMIYEGRLIPTVLP